MNESVSPGTAIDHALFRLRGLWAKPFRQRRAVEAGKSIQLSHLMVISAIFRLQEGSAEEVTVGAVADFLDIDPSTASRLVQDTITAGYAERGSSALDARRARLLLSERGRRLREAMTRLRLEHLDEVMGTWSEPDRQTFAALLTRFVADVTRKPPDHSRLVEMLEETDRPCSGDRPPPYPR
ncbi:MarR family winged helix-turn-helix transcriptional regulator [Rhizohabitans arisaemae]|uniref:MarR family winged helix-turn-helix transcriptional regulator n=1 Tax=Rhizohabitans arisaemae TaxID=2720610 RepID=UPI0024B1CAAD|nr:MarR family winged helix-turn-helix transcriptional regulator [Rhizohabitans arisaemae]